MPNQIIEYYLQKLILYGNKPQMLEYLDFHHLTQADIDNYQQAALIRAAA